VFDVLTIELHTSLMPCEAVARQ